MSECNSELKQRHNKEKVSILFFLNERNEKESYKLDKFDLFVERKVIEN